MPDAEFAASVDQLVRLKQADGIEPRKQRAIEIGLLFELGQLVRSCAEEYATSMNDSVWLTAFSPHTVLLQGDGTEAIHPDVSVGSLRRNSGGRLPD